MKEETIKVLYFPVGAAPKILKTSNELSAMQSLVNGYIEIFPLDSLEPDLNLNALAVLNEEGKITPGIMPNRGIYYQGELFDMFYGNFFICGSDDDGNFTSITPDQEAYYRKIFAV